MDLDKSLSVCVIGQTIKKELFSDQNALGQWLRINDRRFRVIGMLASEGESIGVDFDEMVIIPLAQAQTIFNTRSLFRVLVETKSQQAMAKAIKDIKRIIKDRHESEDDITVITQDSVVGTFDDILTALTLTIAGIAAISLAVAGVLIMNVMLVSVTQRTAEIGLLKALGASKSQIQRLFLTEAVLLSSVGALLGALISRFAVAVLESFYPNFPMFSPQWIQLTTLTVSVFAGLVFGILPARKAAKLNPVNALAKRY